MFAGSTVFQPLFLILLYNLFVKGPTHTYKEEVDPAVVDVDPVVIDPVVVDPAVSSSFLDFLAQHIGFCSLITLTNFALTGVAVGVMFCWLVSTPCRIKV